MRDVPRRHDPGDESSGTPKGAEDGRGQPSEGQTDNKRPADNPVRRPRDDPNGLQALLDYRDERARAEARLLRAERLGHDDPKRAGVPEPDRPQSAAPPARSSPDGKSKQSDDAANRGSRGHEPLRGARPGRPVDPEGLQALLDYRDQRARAEAKLGLAKQREYEDRRRASVPEPDDAPTSVRAEQPRESPGTSSADRTPARGRAAEPRPVTLHGDSSPAGAEHEDARESPPRPTGGSRPGEDGPSRVRPLESTSGADQGVDTREPELVDLIEAGRRAVEKDPGKDRASNRVRPPREGDTNYVVEDPADRSNTITDIDLVMGGTLWEIKKTTGQNPRMKPDEWAASEVPRKLDKYVDARRYLEGYENAPIGLLFVVSGATAHLRTSVDSAVAKWCESNPGESVKVRWAP